MVRASEMPGGEQIETDQAECMDVLDLRGLGTYGLVDLRPEGAGYAGRVVLIDADGGETGQFAFAGVEAYVDDRHAAPVLFATLGGWDDDLDDAFDSDFEDELEDEDSLGVDLDGDDNDGPVAGGSDVKFVTYGAATRTEGNVIYLDSAAMTAEEIENVVPCFTPGTTIATPRGERAVEDLRAGDRVITRDNGIQELRWVGHKTIDGRTIARSPHLKPILIRAGALGHGLPERDMYVSPNHRVLVSNEKTQLYFEEREVLAAAKHLVGSAGIHSVDVMAVTYIHMMFDRHEVVLSDGSWTESFQPGDYSLRGIGNAQRTEIMELFPDLNGEQGVRGFVAARKTLRKHEARLLVE